MSNMMHLSVCLIRCRCCHLLLMHMWFNKCVILLKRQNSRRIPWLCRTDEWVWNHVEPIHVIWRTLARHYTNLSYRFNLATELHPSIIHLFKRKWRHGRTRQNSLDVSKLSYNPLRSMNYCQGTPSEMAGKQRDDLKFFEWMMLTIWNPSHYVRGQSV